ncbi:MAG TPA: CHAT domain-containing protein [Dermatophilaceae bacterium]|nr:CHAT domain-containing protein [Dermatophilaceae bacterium]
MAGDYFDFDIAIEGSTAGYRARVVDSPAGQAGGQFDLPFSAPELAEFIVAVGPPRLPSRRLVPAESRLGDVEDFGKRLNEALFAGPVASAFTLSLDRAASAGKGLRVRLRLSAVPELDSVPWEYLYSPSLLRFLTLSNDTPVVRLLDAATPVRAVAVEPPLRVLAMVSSPSDAPSLDTNREVELLRATTRDLVDNGLMTLDVLPDATLRSLQRALIETYHVFHFIGHGGFDQSIASGVLLLEREDGIGHRVSGNRLGTLLHDAKDLQLAVLNACEGARTSAHSAFSGVAQTLVQQGLPAVVAMQAEISDRAALAFSHEFYYFLCRGLPIERAMCEVRKAMAVADEASEWGTAVLLRSGTEQPFAFATSRQVVEPAREDRWESLYAAARKALATDAHSTALPILEQLAAEKSDYRDVPQLLEQVRPAAETSAAADAEPEADPAAEADPQRGAAVSETDPGPTAAVDEPADVQYAPLQYAPLQNRAWRTRHSAWLLAPILGIGVFTFVGFLYVALRIRRRKYWTIAGAYIAVTALALVLAGVSSDGDATSTLAGMLLLGLWGGGIVHGLVLNRDYLEWRSRSRAWFVASDSGTLVTTPPHVGSDSAVAAPSRPVATATVDVNTATVDVNTATVDVNTATAAVLSALPGLDADWARHILEVRAARRGFSDVDDFAAAVRLYPQQLARLRDHVTFGPRH